jgi:hypothetical protein
MSGGGVDVLGDTPGGLFSNRVGRRPIRGGGAIGPRVGNRCGERAIFGDLGHQKSALSPPG